jgi:hypothetical protein
MASLAGVFLVMCPGGEAGAALREALDRYERKPIIPLARRTRERLATLQPTRG